MNKLPKERSFTEQKIRWVKKYTPKLLSFSITRPSDFNFAAGQFAKLGFLNHDEYVSRAYSMISSEESDHLDFYAILIENGVMSKHFKSMKAGDTLLLEKKSVGFFTVSRIPEGKALILLATGSGIAPFLSMMESKEFWQKSEKVVLVHSVSYMDDLMFKSYLDSLDENSITKQNIDKLIYQPIITRENIQGMLNQRIPTLLATNGLEKALGITFAKEDTRFLICGNPNMVKESYSLLKEKGYELHRVHRNGEIMMENAF